MGFACVWLTLHWQDFCTLDFTEATLSPPLLGEVTWRSGMPTSKARRSVTSSTNLIPFCGSAGHNIGSSYIGQMLQIFIESRLRGMEGCLQHSIMETFRQIRTAAEVEDAKCSYQGRGFPWKIKIEIPGQKAQTCTEEDVIRHVELLENDTKSSFDDQAKMLIDSIEHFLRGGCNRRPRGM